MLREGIASICIWTAYCKTSQCQVPNRGDQDVLHSAQPLDWVFGDSISRDFCSRSLVKMIPGADMGRAISFIRNWRYPRVYKFHEPRKIFNAWLQWHRLQIISTKSRLVNISKICHFIHCQKTIITMSLHLKTVFRLNIFILQAFLYMLDDYLEIKVHYKFGLLLEA